MSVIGLSTPNNALVYAPVTSQEAHIEAIASQPDLSTKEGIIAYIKTKDWDDEVAIKVFNCESGMNPKALNDNPRTRDYSVGIAQINLHGNLAKDRPSEEQLYDAKFNIDYAYSMYKTSKWKPWSCYRMVS